LGTRLGLDWAQQTAARMSPSDPWERLLVNGLARDFQQMRLDFLRRTIMAGKCDPATAVTRWAEAQASPLLPAGALARKASCARTGQSAAPEPAPDRA
jgi:glutamate dehydrogenase